MLNSSALARRGFTLIELIIVLVLVAVIAAMVTVRWSGFQHGPGMEAAVKNIQFIDSHMRRYSFSHGTQTTLEVDLRHHVVRKRYGSKDGNVTRAERLGANIRVDKIDSPTRRVDGHNFELSFFQDGTAPTYGLQLIGSGSQRAYVVFAGMSGQMTRFSSLSDYEHALSLLEKK